MMRPCPRVLALTVFLVAGGCRDLGLNPNTGPNHDTHTTYFPITTQSAHGNVDCNTCHGPFDTFKQFDCLGSGCHPQTDTDGNHAAVPGYAYGSLSCYTCHPTGISVDHTQFFPIGPGVRHNGIGCATCHIDATSRKVFSCTTAPCHSQSETNGHHNGVRGYVYSPTSCYDCHPSGKH
jgi:hypothetical protein